MRRISTILTSAVATAALVAPAAGLATAAQAADEKPAPSYGSSAELAKPNMSLKIKGKKKYSHYGQQGVKVMAVLPKKAKGKVKFTLNGDLLDKKKLKKGKASVRLDQALPPGNYKVKAKYKKVKKTIKTKVFDSSLALSGVAFTVSQSDPFATPFDLTGAVKFKGKPVKEGYVDLYVNGNFKGGNESPDYVGFDTVADDSTFGFDEYDFSDLAERGPGTYTVQGFYTPPASFAEYIYSAPFTITVVP